MKVDRRDDIASLDLSSSGRLSRFHLVTHTEKSSTTSMLHFRKHTGRLLDTQDIKFDKMCITNYI